MEGQRALSTIVDLAFFVVIGLLGWHKVLSEAVLATLLSAYTAHRFGIASGKQQAIVALGSAGSSGGSVPPGSSGGGSSGQSQRMAAVREEATRLSENDKRRLMREGNDAYHATMRAIG